MKQVRAKAWNVVFDVTDNLEAEGADWARGSVRTCWRINGWRAGCWVDIRYRQGSTAECEMRLRFWQAGSRLRWNFAPDDTDCS